VPMQARATITSGMAPIKWECWALIGYLRLHGRTGFGGDHGVSISGGHP
jgi:hypothetical protein